MPHPPKIWERVVQDGIEFPYKYNHPKLGMFKRPVKDLPIYKRKDLKKNFPVIITKDIPPFGKAGDIKYVPRASYRHYLLEKDGAIPLNEEMVRNSPELMSILDTEHPPINTNQVIEETFQQAKNILSSGIKINYDSLAPWIVTPFHLARIIAYRTGFDILPQHIKMHQPVISTVGTYMIDFEHENGIKLQIPITVTSSRNN